MNMTITREEASMEIILNAGDGRQLLLEALDFAANSGFDDATAKLASAETKIKMAHKVQTEVMQDAIANNEEEGSRILFAHAQDTLMSINSEFLLIKKMLVVLANINERFETLEKRLDE